MNEYTSTFGKKGLGGLLQDVRAIESGVGGVTTYGLFNMMDISDNLKTRAEKFRDNLSESEVSSIVEDLNQRIDDRETYSNHGYRYSFYSSLIPITLYPLYTFIAGNFDSEQMALSLIAGIVTGELGSIVTNLTAPGKDNTGRLKRVKDYLMKTNESLVEPGIYLHE